MRKVLNTDVFYDDIATQFIADSINGKDLTETVAGAAAATAVTLPSGNIIGTVHAVVAYVTATGAPATKALLVSGTDYSVNASGQLVCVTAQAANTLVVTYSLS
jgi:hypothetical protein